MEIKRGDIIYIQHINIKGLGQNVQKADRPFVVISNNINNEKSPTINIASLTTQITKIKHPMHVYLSKKAYSELKSNSLILTEQVITINKNLVKKVITSLSERDKRRLNRALIIQLLLDDPNNNAEEGEK